MNITIHKSFFFAIIGLLLILILPGCSGPQEDVRISFCKRLTHELLEPVGEPVWKDIALDIQRPEYAAIKILFENSERAEQDDKQRAACFYAYVTVEENIMTQTDPLSAYSTLPYKVILNDQIVPEPMLSAAMNAVQQQMGIDLIESVKKTAEDTMQKAKASLQSDSG